jgi:chromosome segregation ATPase
MNRKLILAGLCVLILAAASLPARAQEDAAQMAEDVAGLNRSLERMVVLLESLIGNQQVDILLKRIELKERRLAPLESELRRAERAMIDVEARLKRMQEEAEEMVDVIADEVRAGIDREGSDSRRTKDQLERVINAESSRVDEMRRRVQQLENELASGRDEIVILDEQLLELLQ